MENFKLYSIRTACQFCEAFKGRHPSCAIHHLESECDICRQFKKTVILTTNVNKLLEMLKLKCMEVSEANFHLEYLKKNPFINLNYKEEFQYRMYINHITRESEFIFRNYLWEEYRLETSESPIKL